MAADMHALTTWFQDGVKNGATHMVVVCYDFGHEDYPVYVMPGSDPHDTVKHYQAQPMQRIMEVYALHLPMEDQMKEFRAFHYDMPDGSKSDGEFLSTAVRRVNQSSTANRPLFGKSPSLYEGHKIRHGHGIGDHTVSVLVKISERSAGELNAVLANQPHARADLKIHTLGMHWPVVSVQVGSLPEPDSEVLPSQVIEECLRACQAADTDGDGHAGYATCPVCHPENFDLPTDENGCYTLPDGTCIAPGECMHTERPDVCC